MYQWAIYLEDEDDPEEDAFLGYIFASSMSEALEKAAAQFGHDVGELSAVKTPRTWENRVN